jgi:hypothetical protein
MPLRYLQEAIQYKMAWNGGSISILDTIAKVKMSLWLWDYLLLARTKISTHV